MARVLVLRATPVAPDPRVEKTARWLHDAGHTVHVLGWDRTGSLPAREPAPWGEIERLAIPAGFGQGLRGMGPLLTWQGRLLGWLVRHGREFDVVHACDFDTVVPALAVARARGMRLVYDIYDFYVECRSFPEPLRTVVRGAERLAVRMADATIIVDELRRAQLGDARPRRLEVVYNSPDDLPLARAASRRAGGVRAAFVGVLAENRCLLQVVDAFRDRPDWRLDLAGYGEDEAAITARAAGVPNVVFHGRVPYDRALALSAAADVLFAIYDPAVPNHRLSSANKLFEAMMLGKPIVVARGTGMDRYVEEHGLGFVVRYGAVDEIAAAFDAVAAWSEDERARFAERARGVYERHFSAALMRERLVGLYREILPAGRPAPVAA